MKRDAETHAEEDKRKREFADATQRGRDAASTQVEKAMKEAGDKLTDSDKAPINAAIEKVKDAVSRRGPRGDQVRDLRAGDSVQRDGPARLPPRPRGQPAARTPADQPGAAEKKDGGDDVIDAEYEVKK